MGVLGLLELAVVAAIFVGANVYRVVPISETPWIVLIGWRSLWWRGRGWRSVGLVRPASWTTALSVAAVTAVAVQLLSTFTEPLVTRLTGRAPDLTSFAPLVGNVKSG